MKKINIMKGLAVAAVAFTLGSCSSDYLDLEPISNESSESIPYNVSKLRSAVYGTMQSTYRQYGYWYDYRFFNGEPWYDQWYGESMGQDYNSYWVAGSTGYGFTNWTHMNSYGTWGAMIAWSYPYGIISQANYIIAGEKTLEETEELKGETAFRMAQAYTMRAHGYIRLHQMFGPRWVDSNNGEVTSVVIRTEAPDANKPSNMAVSTTNEVLKLIYDDLDRALELYEMAEFGRDYDWEVDETVAYGLYARAALLKNDWENAEKYAHLASENYTVMTAAEYKSGFNTANSEWMWCSDDGSKSGLYFASFNASFGCNGAYPCIWQAYGAGAVDYMLYKKMYSAKDVRCELFYTPDKEGRALRANFWSEDDVAQNMNMNQGDNFPVRLQAFCDKMYEEIGRPNGWIFPYIGGQELFFGGGDEIGDTYIPFGAQFKFWGKDTYGAGQYPFMRASEMLLIEAEAACHNNHFSVAQDCLYKINSNRIEGYTKSSKTGDDLLDEVKLNRRWELWGEGFSWYDFKRWNEPIDRVAWVPGDVNSGNWADGYAKKFEVNEFYNWVWPIPSSEVDYNESVMDRTHEEMETM